MLGERIDLFKPACFFGAMARLKTQNTAHEAQKGNLLLAGFLGFSLVAMPRFQRGELLLPFGYLYDAKKDVKFEKMY